MKRHAIVIVLSVLAVAQLTVLAFRADEGPPPGRRIAAGDDLGSLLVSDASGALRPLAQGAPALLLVFHSECAHCRRVAPDWRAWLEASGQAERVLAVSAEPLGTAAEYAAQNGWPVPVVNIDAGERGSREHALTSRTPWVFVLGADGRVLGEGHGTGLAELASLLDPAGDGR